MERSQDIFKKPEFWAKFDPLTLFKFYSTLTSCQVSEKLNEAFSKNACRRRTDGQMDGWDQIYRTSVGSARGPKIPVIFHNLRGYDSHLILKKVGKFDVKVNVIPNGLEKHMAFTINKNLVFIDSMQFMNSCLGSLVKNLPDNDFKYLSEKFSGEVLELVKEKGVYPYEYMDSFKKFSENKLPDKCKFFSSLKDECISEKDYERANNIWNAFKINSMSDYHDLYLKTNVLLLADIFEKFIKMCLDYYGLDPCHYFSSPRLSWDAMLKMTGIELGLISDTDMHLFIEKGMGGSISYIAKRYSKANNKYMENYDSCENKMCSLFILMPTIYTAGP